MESFNFQPGRIISQKYRILQKLGSGLEGEVYQIQETETDILRAAKFFYPEYNRQNRALKKYAQKLHLLSDCPILVHYNTTETIQFKGEKLLYLVSDFVNGIQLSCFVKKFPGKRLHYYQAFHLFYQLVRGLAMIHARRSFHGDIHSDNVMIHSFGLQHRMKLIDFHDIGVDKRVKMKQDVIDVIYLFHEMLGADKHYQKLPKEIQYILAGKRMSLIEKRFRNMQQLKLHLENLYFRSIL
jgi:serine/threonine protein kinase